MKCATFNILHGRPVRAGRPVPLPDAAAQELLAGAFASLDADIVALQEVDRFQDRSGRVDQAAVAARVMGAADWRYASTLHGRAVVGKGWVLDPAEPGLRVYGPRSGVEAGVPSHGVALVTRLPVRAWYVRRLTAAPVGLPLRVAGRSGLTFVPDQPRAALAAVVEGERGPFTVAAVHLSFVPGWNVGQLEAVRRWLAGLPMPHVLLGDFNLAGPVPWLLLAGAAWERPPVEEDTTAAGGTWPARPPTPRTVPGSSSIMCWQPVSPGMPCVGSAPRSCRSPTTGRSWSSWHCNGLGGGWTTHAC